MIIETQRTKIKSVVDRWKKSYPSAKWPGYKQETLKRLEALDLDSCSDDDVKKIIGNSSWTDLEDCDECGASSVQTVMLGEAPDDESSTAWICKSCLQKAISLIESVE